MKTRGVMSDEKKDEEVKTKFKGPGQWRSQAAKLERERDEKPEQK